MQVEAIGGNVLASASREQVTAFPLRFVGWLSMAHKIQLEPLLV